METQDSINIEDYLKETRILEDFNSNMGEILDLIPESGVRFNDIIINDPRQLYDIFSNDPRISQKMNEYIGGLGNEAMLVLAIVTDVGICYGRIQNNFNLFRMLIESSDDQNFKYNFTIVCIHYMKYHLLPEILKDIESRNME